MCVCVCKSCAFVVANQFFFPIVPCTYYSNSSSGGSSSGSGAAVLQWSVNEPCVGPNIFLMLPGWRHHFVFFFRSFSPLFVVLYSLLLLLLLLLLLPVLDVAFVVAFTAAFGLRGFMLFFLFLSRIFLMYKLRFVWGLESATVCV